MNSACSRILAMLPAFTLKGPQPQALPKLDSIINPIISIIKQCWQADTSCSETTHRSMVSKHHLSLVNAFHSVSQGSLALEISCN